MSETQRIVALSRRAINRGEQVCLATVVHVEGSSYRKPGARMLLTSGGERAGTISGGCLESEVSRKAWWLTAGGSRVERYSSFADEDGGMPYGLGCGGTVTLLLEQGAPAQAVLAALEWTLSKREPAVVITGLGAALLPGEGADINEYQDAGQFQHAALDRSANVAGTLAVLRLASPDQRILTPPSTATEGTRSGKLEAVYLCERSDAGATRDTTDGTLNPRLLQAAHTVFVQQRSCLLSEGFSQCDQQPAGAVDAPAYFVEYLGVPPSLTIFGAGDDVQPIAALAHALGWRVTVADGRAHLARRDRFPQAAEVRVLDYADPALRSACGMARAESKPPSQHHPQHQTAATATLLLDAKGSSLLYDDIAVVMTHSYEQDRALLTALLPLGGLRYLGILGPRHRTERLLAEVAPSTGLSIDEGFARLHSPIGLDLGATDPATVALSIVAEIQASLQGRAVSLNRTDVQGAAARVGA